MPPAISRHPKRTLIFLNTSSSENGTAQYVAQLLVCLPRTGLYQFLQNFILYVQRLQLVLRTKKHESTL